MVSIDPGEGPGLASAKKATYVAHYDRESTAGAWHFLTGHKADIDRLAQTVGFSYSYDEKTDQYAHAAGLSILTPDGRIARYLFGIDFAPRDLRLAIVEAADRKIGSPVDSVLLYCYHYDPATGNVRADGDADRADSRACCSCSRWWRDGWSCGVVSAAACTAFPRWVCRRALHTRRKSKDMGGTFTLFPTQASTMAGRVDNLYFFMLAVTVFFSVVVAGLVVTLAVKYRRRKADDVGANIHGSTALEVIWTAIPLLIAMVMFVWGTSVYFALAKPPAEAMEVYIVGKRWMWKAQHLTGHREINQLHVPVGTPVKLLISSEDVIHAYYIPAFRQKIDAVPGKTTTMWFEASKAGTYQLFCAEYCGTQHSGMIGKVVAMEPREYPAVAQRRRAGRDADLERRAGIRHARLRDLPPRRRHGSRAVARRRVRQAAAAGQRHDRHRR